jgi:DNA repair protein RadA/Sms
LARQKTRYVCSECGYESLRWMGRCPGCDSWNTFVEEVVSSDAAGRRADVPAESAPPVRLDEIAAQGDVRASTGLIELDRVLGGGMVPGSLVLIGGDPGIGKSTLLLQVCPCLAAEASVLYVSAEESAAQIKMRAARMRVDADQLYLTAENNLEAAFAHVEKLKPHVLIIDSIQTMYTSRLTAAPGSVSQVRETTAMLLEYAKRSATTVFIVGHVTKEGAIAGPRVLEHMVDTVLYFEGDSHHAYRVLRAAKNRFGSTNEIGVFEMTDRGLTEIQNPSAMLLSGRTVGAPGSAVLCSMEGSRPVLMEVQALVTPTAFGMPRRMATGLDHNRAILLAAVLEKKAGLHLGTHDIYLNAAGGLKVDEPAVDLAIVAAIAGSLRETPVPPDTVVMGEVGLTGEVRGVGRMPARIQECRKLGFKRCVIPADNLKNLPVPDGLNVKGIRTVGEFLETVFPR